MTMNNAGENILQILLANQLITNDSNDIMYWGRAPYTPGSNGGMYYSDFLAQLQSVLANLPVVVVTASSQQLAVNTRYFINRPSLVMLTMPTTANIGDKIEIVNMSNSFQVSQSSGMNIRLKNLVTTTGVAGYIASSEVGDSITLECTNTNDFYQATNVIGNITVF